MSDAAVLKGSGQPVRADTLTEPDLPSLAERRTRPWLVVGTLLEREFVRFVRQKHRVFGALGQPVIFLLLFGAGWSGSFRHPDVLTRGYAEYFFPGTLMLILLFTAIFSTISIIEDRTAGFLQSVLVAPAPPWSVALGKILGGTLLALAQATILLVFAPLLGIPFHPVGWLGAITIMALVAFSMTGLGFLFAWRMDSVQGYHAIMNVVLLPMWLLSGALFPAAGAAGWMRWVMAANPLTYGTTALRHMLYWSEPEMTVGLTGMATALSVTILFAAAALGGSIWIAARPSRGGS